jgi:hypothetical protein
VTKTALGVLCLLALAGANSTKAAALTYGGERVTATGPTEVSSNWSGYTLTSADPAGTTAFSDVTGTWVQPKVSCRVGRRDAVAFWVGLGGNSEGSNALEQLGTAAECNGLSTKPRYSVWWEIIPAASVEVKLKLSPGDKVTAAVLVNDNQVTMSLKNVTHGTRFTKTVTVPQVDTASAEWIVEAPSNCDAVGQCRVVPLTKFGTVAFSNAAAIGDGVPDTLASPTWALNPITLITGGAGSGLFGDQTGASSGVGAVPSGITSDGRGFTVTWRPNVTAG